MRDFPNLEEIPGITPIAGECDPRIETVKPKPEPDRVIAIDSEGWEFDVATGEVVGRVDTAEDFAIDSPERADWALEVRSKIEGDLAGTDARLRAVTAQLTAIRRGHERRLAWWDFRFRSQLVTLAKSLLRGKAKTLHFNWGHVSFRTTKGTNQIVDMAAAVEWAKVWKPEIVRKVETVRVSDILATVPEVEDQTGENESLPFVVSSGAGENVEISTGVEERGAR